MTRSSAIRRFRLQRVVRAGRRGFRTVLEFGKNAWREFALRVFRGAYPHRIYVVNLLATDICNLRCEMCEIWRQKRRQEIGPEDLRRILSDRVFRHVVYVGVSGGEPTLRRDLPELFESICRALPDLYGTGIITNSWNPRIVLDRIRKSAEACSRFGVGFNVMLSIDGVGGVHDSIRGHEGNFRAATDVLRALRDDQVIPVVVGCTITKSNVWDADNVLAFCRREGVQVRFRVAEFIDRLYNRNCRNVIRNFDEDESYNLALLFFKLEYAYESNVDVKATYRSIRRMVYEGAQRTSGCPYQSNSVVLSSRGELTYCAPRSPILGSCLERPAGVIYRDHLERRREIVDRECAACIHDYHSPPPAAMRVEERRDRYWRGQMSLRRALARARRIPDAVAEPLRLDTVGALLITGWYGTETAGDKAILAAILDRAKKANPSMTINVTSIYPFVTIRTLKELGVEDVEVVPAYSRMALERARHSDLVLIGGGPLMGIEPLGLLLSFFAEARRRGKRTAIEGCGIGPIGGEAYDQALRELVRLSGTLSCRDSASVSWVSRNCARDDVLLVADPAIAYVQFWKTAHPVPARARNHRGFFLCCFRELTDEYTGEMSGVSFSAFKARFERELVQMVDYVRSKTGWRAEFVPMHTFVVGGDDRDFVRNKATQGLVAEGDQIWDRVYPVEEILRAFSACEFAFCMRYHSVVFAQEMGAPYVAIDYSGRGKIRNFLVDRGRSDLCLDRMDVAEGNWRRVVDPVVQRVMAGKS